MLPLCRLVLLAMLMLMLIQVLRDIELHVICDVNAQSMRLTVHQSSTDLSSFSRRHANLCAVPSGGSLHAVA